MKNRPRTTIVRLLFTHVLPPLVLLAIVLLAWQAIVVAFDIKPYLIPKPLEVWHAAGEHASDLLSAAKLTAAGALCGFAASLVTGIMVSLVFAQSKIIERSAYPYAVFLQTVPIVAIAPIVINLFGAGFLSVVVVAFIISLFPIITNTTAGLTTVNAALLELFAMYNASRWQQLWRLRLPSAVPYVVTGAKISCGLSLIGAIVGEFSAGFGTNSFGLGYLIIQSSSQLKIDNLFAAVLCSALLGVMIFGLVSVIGATILAWWHIDASKH